MAPLQDITVKNMSDIDFHLSTSIKVKCFVQLESPKYDFLLVSNMKLNVYLSPFRSYSHSKNVLSLSYH